MAIQIKKYWIVLIAMLAQIAAFVLVKKYHVSDAPHGGIATAISGLFTFVAQRMLPPGNRTRIEASVKISSKPGSDPPSEDGREC